MHSLEAALAWDFIRRGAMLIPLVLLTMIALPLWLFEALGREGGMDPSSVEAVAMHVTLTLVMGFGAAVAVIQALGPLQRFFPRPISAARLVACHMGCGILTAAAMYLISAGILNLRGVAWPLLGPAMFVATATACGLASIWVLEGSDAGRMLGCTATTLPLVLWFNRCYGARIMGDWKAMWRNPTAAEALTLGGVVAAAFLVSVYGVARVRRGDRWDFAALRAWWEERDARGAAPAKFRGPLFAQLWSEQREKLRFVPPCLIAALLVFSFAVYLSGGIERRKFLEMIFSGPILGLTIILPMIAGLVWGNCGGGSGNRGMKTFLAARPVTDAFLARALLSNITLGMIGAWGAWLIGWLLIVAAVCTWAEISGVWTTFRQLIRQDVSQVIFYASIPLISWTLTALLATLTATGRPTLWFSVLATIFGTAIAFMLLKQVLSEPAFNDLVTGLHALIGGAAIAGLVAAYTAALRRRLVSGVTAAAAGGLFVVLAATMFVQNQPGSPREFLWACFLIGAANLISLPFAAMPLAVCWNRHR